MKLKDKEPNYKQRGEDFQKLLDDLRPHDHLCLIYESQDEWLHTVIPFMRAGLERGEKCLYVVDSHTAEEVKRHLEEAGADVAGKTASGQFSVIQETDAYTKGGSFDPDRMIGLIIEETKKALREGYPALRVTGEMTWVLRDVPGSEKILEYEAKLNRDLFPLYPCIALCQYDRWRFHPDVIKGVVLTHPLLIRGLRVHRNFYYIPPEEFLNHKRAELEIQHWLNNIERERQFQEVQYALSEKAPFGMAMIEKDGTFSYVNPKFTEILGYGLSDVPTGREWFRKAYPDSSYRHEVISTWLSDLSVSKVGEQRPRTFTVTCKDGRRKVINFIPVLLDEGRNILTIEDITGLKEAEETLRRSEEKYRSIFENAVEGIFQSTPEGHLISANPAYARIFGYDNPEELVETIKDIGRDIYDNPEDRLRFKKTIDREGVVRLFEFKARKKDGTPVWVCLNARVVRDEAGGVVCYEGTVEDITPRRTAEQSARESEDKYRRLFDLESDAIFLIDNETGRILEANNAASSLYGYSKKELLGKKNTDLSAEPDETQRATKEGLTSVPIRYHRKKDGTVFIVEITATHLDWNGRRMHLAAIRDVTGRIRAEEELRRSEEKYRTIFDNAMVGIFQSTPEGQYLETNRALASIHGFSSPEEMIKTVTNIGEQLYVDPKDRARYMELLEGTDMIRGFEAQLYRKDKSTVWISMNVKAVRNPDGSVACYEGIVEDITPHKRAEEELATAHRLLSSILDSVPDLINVIDRDYRILYSNDKGHGPDLQQDLKKEETCYGRFKQLDAPCENCSAQPVFQTGCMVEQEMRNPVDGSIREVRAFPVFDGMGNVEQVVKHTRDITDRKKAEEEVIRERSKLKTLSDNAPFGLVLIDGKGRFTYMNDRFTTLFGYGPDDIPDGRTWFRKAYPDTEYRRTVIATWVEDMREALPGEKTPRVFTVTCADGTQRIVSFIPSVLVSGDYLMTCEDMTELKRLESQLLQSQKMEAVGTLAGGIAHDFNNILTALMGYASLMQMKMDRDSPLMPYVEQVLKASEKAADLTRGLLTFSRQQPVTLSPLDMNDALEETKKLLKRLLTEDIDLATSLTTEDTAVMADRSQMDQVLFNLAANARDAMPRGGTLTVSTSVAEIDGPFIDAQGFGSPGRYVVVTVSDTGLGMDEATRARIFDPFFTTKEVGKGTGLGLATVYGIIEQHGGHITVESEPGRGTSFSIYLPAVNMGTGEEGDIQAPVRGGRETVLVAEDNKEVRRFIREALSQHGYVTVEASDGQDAVEKFKHHGGIDLVIIDSVMPKKNGREAYEEMRAMDPRVRAIFISGHTRDVVLEKGIGEGEFDFIAKPLSPAVLLQKVREVLER